jgi:hypothetical protein
MSDLTSEGDRRVSIYLAAQENLRRAKSTLGSAECDASNAEASLAKWLMPSDMKPGEKIAVWRGDSLFQVELVPREAYAVGGDSDGKVVTDHVPKITVRLRGKNFGRLQEKP